MPIRFSPPRSARRGSRSSSPTSPRSRSTPSSTPPTPRCSGGGGVDGAIHRAAGPRAAGRMPDARRLRHRLGQDHARLSAAGEARHPCGRPGVERRRAAASRICWPRCYRTALALAAEHGLRSLAFPAISTGVYRFPADLAARIAVGTVVSELSPSARGIERVVFCCFSDELAEHHIERVRGIGLGVAHVPLTGLMVRSIAHRRCASRSMGAAGPPHPSRRACIAAPQDEVAVSERWRLTPSDRRRAGPPGPVSAADAAG